MKKTYFLLIALCFFATTKAQIVNIPDANFKAKLLLASTTNQIAYDSAGFAMKIDNNSDGEIQVSEALQVSYLDISNSSIVSLIGIKSFTNLTNINCSANQLITIDLGGLINLQTLECSFNKLLSIDVSGLVKLQTLNCNWNKLQSLDVNSLPNLIKLDCSLNQLPSIDVSGLINLTNLYCGNNLLPSLDVSGLTNLTDLSCNNNLLPSLDVSGLTNLTYLYCPNNKLTSLDVSGLNNLTYLYCNNNQLTSLKVSGLTNLIKLDCYRNYLSSIVINDLTNLQWLDCEFNSLVSLFLKNGKRIGQFFFNNNHTLKYICADEVNISYYRNIATTYSLTNCQVNSYCSFTPGGDFYTIQGKNKFDNDNNGCDVSDPIISNLYLKETNLNGDIIGSYISNSTGNYSISVQAGTHTISPVIENPTYFNVSPATTSVPFPTQTSPFTQNFCITPNGVHPDLEITLLPLRPVVPGFDTNYKIVYKNKGNTTQSGSVNLTFNDSVLDLVVSNPVTSTQITNNLSWNFTNLLPFETREIELTLNVNSPMETPAVNGGDILAFIATITSAATDEKPIDNTFAFNQIVFNSFDPNDKTCLEGTTISPALIGQYVHYMVRFENKGTANAQNIVVKDMIDLTKFDISTLIPTNASHSFVTNITAGNKVEFIFENINLPFDDANNDGYIAFKIKTLPTLKVGDTFTNDVSIYFDYNFPIVTNKATSTFKTLGTQDFEFSNYFTLYPNPANEVLNISSKEGIEMKSISIYNTLGQLVLVIPNAEKVSKIDVSNLTTGNYFIKINSDKGTSNTRFIKE